MTKITSKFRRPDEFRYLHLMDPGRKSEYMGFIKRAGTKEARRNAQAEIEEQLVDILNEEELDLQDAWDEDERRYLAARDVEDAEYWARVREMEERDPDYDWYAEVDDGYAKWLERKHDREARKAMDDIEMIIW